ncbi:DUF6875 domain-containing protein [Erythrobacter sp. EC-HK427]|uniref:DUF6875 domain-containing protein n=1 Tax=Erythrobacter sp. EC-HK427 TaxID=2038396 RepID=UPI00125A6242|nr:hypothetical protein [Erythrobacter sp. EC-HK427]VVS96177.1 hypothetical protein ERY430_30027 [Erythrobacter sp. EC-HK427]
MGTEKDEIGRNTSQANSPFGTFITPEQLRAQQRGSVEAVYDLQTLEKLAAIAGYAETFLTAPHPKLGRKGAVCPYVRGSLDRCYLKLGGCNVMSTEPTVVVRNMARVIDIFQGMLPDASDEPGESMYRTILVVFTELSAKEGSELVEAVQKLLKPGFIDQGLMIGEFYPSCPAKGLHSDEFRPLQTPVPCLAVREITLFDAPFMLEDDLYVAGYLRRFGQAGAERLAKAISTIATGPDRVVSVRNMLRAYPVMCPHISDHASRA